VICQCVQAGVLHTDGVATYRIPALADVPKEMHVTLVQGVRNDRKGARITNLERAARMSFSYRIIAGFAKTGLGQSQKRSELPLAHYNA